MSLQRFFFFCILSVLFGKFQRPLNYREVRAATHADTPHVTRHSLASLSLHEDESSSK